MADDDFQFVDITQPVSHPVSISREDADDLDSDMLAISDLHSLKHEVSQELKQLKLERQRNAQERKALDTLKSHLKSHIEGNKRVAQEQRVGMKQMQSQMNEYAALNSKLQNELKVVESTRVALDEERTKLKMDRDKLKRQMEEMNALLKELRLVHDIAKSNKSIKEDLEAIYGDTIALKKKSRELQELKDEHNNLIKQTKLEIDKYRLLKQLDKNEAYACKDCGTHIGLESDIESRCYQVGQGTFTEKKRGYLFTKAVNLKLGPVKTENFTTGSYKISWVSCIKCEASLGWKYLSADTASNGSKVGKLCLARYSLTSPQERA